MNLLDYWSGKREHVLDFWREGYWIAALRKYVQSEVWEITIHALDALEIKGRSSEEHDWVRYEFYNYFPDLPAGLDIICALHPNPGVLIDGGWMSSDEEFEESRYLWFLTRVIWQKARDRARIVLQLDDVLGNMYAGAGTDIFLKKLHSYWKWYGYNLAPLNWLTPTSRFPSASYTFSSFHLFEKQSLEN